MADPCPGRHTVDWERSAKPLSERPRGEGFNGGVLRLVPRQVEIAQGDIQRFIEGQLIVGNRPRETHGKLMVPACEIPPIRCEANAPVAALVPATV